jgi:hypothetical protein
MTQLFWNVIFPLIVVAVLGLAAIIYVCFKPSLWPFLTSKKPERA